jgi:hypothetical protein
VRADAIERGHEGVERRRRGGPRADEGDERGVVLGERRADGGGEDVGRRTRERVAGVQRDRDAETLEGLEEFAQGHRSFRRA